MATAEVSPVHHPRQLNIYICLAITFSVATITLTLRLIARRLMKLNFWYDDYLAVVAFLCATVWTGLTLWWLQIGLGLYLADVHLPASVILERSRLILWNAELFYAFSLAFAKLAILAFYWRTFKTSNIRSPIQILFGCVSIWLILRTFLAVLHCVPVQKFWKPELRGICKVNDSEFFFGTVLVHFLLDIVILALPVIEVQKLHLPLMQRLGIMGMFLFGIFVCVASVIVLAYSIKYDTSSEEMPWNISPIIIWATVEVNLAIVSACLPMLRPIWLLVLRKPLTKNSSSGGYSHSYPQSTLPGDSHRFSITHKLATLTVHGDVNRPESELTHQIASKAVHEGSISSNEDYERDAVPHGNKTVIVGSAEMAERLSNEADEERGSVIARRCSGSEGGRDGRWSSLGGILVTNEISVSDSRISQ